MTQTPITERTEKSRAAVLFAKIMQRDTAGRVSKVGVPGSECKRYDVIIRRNGVVSCECNLITGGKTGAQPCKGAAHSVCYHSIAALLVAAADAGKHCSFANTKETADLLSRTGGDVFEVKSHNGNGASLWMIVRSTAPAKVEAPAVSEAEHGTLTLTA